MQPRCVRRHLRSPLSLNLKRRHLDASQRAMVAAIDGTVNDFSTLGSTQDSVEGVYLALELIGRAQQVAADAWARRNQGTSCRALSTR